MRPLSQHFLRFKSGREKPLNMGSLDLKPVRILGLMKPIVTNYGDINAFRAHAIDFTFAHAVHTRASGQGAPCSCSVAMRVRSLFEVASFEGIASFLIWHPATWKAQASTKYNCCCSDDVSHTSKKST